MGADISEMGEQECESCGCLFPPDVIGNHEKECDGAGANGPDDLEWRAMDARFAARGCDGAYAVRPAGAGGKLLPLRVVRDVPASTETGRVG